jgi:hypothetical protein
MTSTLPAASRTKTPENLDWTVIAEESQMQEHGQYPMPQFGDYRMAQDYSRDQLEFLRSIEEEMPEVLADLKDSVLPLFIASRPHREEFRGYQGETWPAIWDWAARSGLVRVKDVPLLKDNDAAVNAREMAIHYGCRCISYPGEPYKPHSPAKIFYLTTLSQVVQCTLRSWSESTVPDQPRWVFPELPSSFFDFFQESYRPILSDTDDMERYYFKVKGWNPCWETRENATKRIMRELATRLRDRLDLEEDIAKRTGKVKQHRIINNKHFRWLALYQVKRWNNARIAHEFEDDPTSSETVRQGVRNAAQLVAGPNWKSWLRRGQPGRPRKERPS